MGSAAIMLVSSKHRAFIIYFTLGSSLGSRLSSEQDVNSDSETNYVPAVPSIEDLTSRLIAGHANLGEPGQVSRDQASSQAARGSRREEPGARGPPAEYDDVAADFMPTSASAYLAATTMTGYNDYNNNCKVEYNNNTLRVSLAWNHEGDNFRNDLDLWVTTPSNERIGYSHKKSCDGVGNLDLDCLKDHPKPAENIVWTHSVPSGRFRYTTLINFTRVRWPILRCLLSFKW